MGAAKAFGRHLHQAAHSFPSIVLMESCLGDQPIGPLLDGGTLVFFENRRVRGERLFVATLDMYGLVPQQDLDGLHP